MGSLKVNSLALIIFLHLCSQGIVEGKSLSQPETTKSIGNKVKNFVHGVIQEFGYRVGALELPEERRGIVSNTQNEGLRAESGSNETSIEVATETSTSSNYGNILGSSSNRYVYNLYWH